MFVARRNRISEAPARTQVLPVELVIRESAAAPALAPG